MGEDHQGYEGQELWYSPGLLGPGLGTVVWFASVGTVEFSGMCFSSRSGKRLKKTRKYDIITTPAERVEMAPLNEEDDEDEDSTVFDIKYRYRWGQQLPPGFLDLGWWDALPLKTPQGQACVLVLWSSV